MFRNLMLLAGVALTLSACGLQSDDNYGVYADGEFYFVANYRQHKINFTSDAHPGPDILLGAIAQGKGLGFTALRDKPSCGRPGGPSPRRPANAGSCSTFASVSRRRRAPTVCRHARARRTSGSRATTTR